jgi:hypothetical protein
MSDDNVVSFPGTNGPEKEAKEESRVTANDVLKAAMGAFDDVVVIGIAPGKAQCISTLRPEYAVFELSRAIHRIHERATPVR